MSKILTTKQKEEQFFIIAKKELGYKNKLASPKLVKIVVGSGIGSALKKDKNKGDLIIDRLSKITGQKPSIRGAKKSIAGFKIRQGDPVGATVTLRGSRMYKFLDKLIDISLPRSKDFRGINKKSVDNIGNLTIGLREHSIFPETSNEELKDVFGLSISLISTAKSKEEALKFFEFIGIPFKK